MRLSLKRAMCYSWGQQVVVKNFYSGKTLIAKTIAQFLDVPFSMNDASPFTQTGYVGDDVEMCIHRLLQNADYDVARAERGIVFIDEIDKLAKRSDATNPSQRDVSGEGVQQGLLRMLEGTVVTVTPKNAAGRGGFAPGANNTFQVNTSEILFICAGAFVGIDRIISERVNERGSIGFSAPLAHHIAERSENNILDKVQPADLIKYGFIPEFVGRIPCFACATALDVDQLSQVLTEPKNALIKQYVQLLKCSNVSSSHIRSHYSFIRML